MNLSTEPVQLVLSHMYIISFDASFMFRCVCSRYGFQRMLLIQIYRYTCACLCTPLGIHHTTRWRVSDSLRSHAHIPEFGACGFSWLLIKDAQRKRGSSADRPKPFPFRPPVRLLSFPFVTHEHLLYYS